MFQTTNQINNLQILGFSKYIMENLQVIKHMSLQRKTPNDVKPVELLQNGFPMYSSTTGFWKQLSSGCSLKIPSWMKINPYEYEQYYQYYPIYSQLWSVWLLWLK